jgi:hypothetical protein
MMHGGVLIPTLPHPPVSRLNRSPHLPPVHHWTPVNRALFDFLASHHVYIFLRLPDEKKKKKRKRADESDDDLGIASIFCFAEE